MTDVMMREREGRSSENAHPRFLDAERLTRLLLACGVASSVLYAAVLVFVPMRWPGYDSASFTVSELSAIGAPTRALWVSWLRVWTLLYLAFGIGVWRAAGRHGALRVAGGVIVLSAVFGAFWPPMHQREILAAGGSSLTDTLHVVWTAVNGVLTLLAMGLSAAALAGWFRRYSIVSMLVLLATGVLTSLAAPGVDANLPTPFIGVWERINIGAWLAWVAVLAVKVLPNTLARER